MTSARAEIITQRTYCRPKDDGTTETWPEVVQRVVGHQRWLWERAKGEELTIDQEAELAELALLMLDRKCLLAGRTLWLGGTETVKRREASSFNCAFLAVETVSDVVDAIWLLLQGCGVGFEPVPGTLCGFTNRMPVEIIRSTRTTKGGADNNVETYENGVWTIRVGDSAEAWAKAVGKLVAGKAPADKLVLDFSEIRPGGERLAGYGWICSGDGAFARALEAIAGILNRRSGQLLTKLDIMDIMNWLGTVLSSRRSAEIALVDYGSTEWADFAVAKDQWWERNPQRCQSNNSLVFHQKPSRHDLEGIFDLMVKSGGSEPGIINASAARTRAPWFRGVNP